MASSGAWMGSSVDGAELRRLRSEMLIGQKEEIGTHVPGNGELSPAPAANESVVFSSHLARGLALPASPFLREFLDFYGL